jgi:hypothetical protein
MKFQAQKFQRLQRRGLNTEAYRNWMIENQPKSQVYDIGKQWPDRVEIVELLMLTTGLNDGNVL